MRLRAAGLVLALAAITFKAFLPPGFMPAEHDGRVGIVMCSGVTNAASLDLSRSDHAPSSPRQDTAGQHCPFAVAGAAAFAPHLIEVAAPTEAPIFVVAATPLATRPHATRIGPPLPARGPPLQA
ncbi:hypothetical protein DSM104635_02797 [Terricaulis silvestris]|uniref:DUF2946 domain-containing protein n=2 Tax=Terricaulis silvestris TaxID=2686094 RepID=A0A6I6MWE9_9CAUL|nr:hypothetical protein DSM104635_02797 [Terricaulis silvestris]